MKIGFKPTEEKTLNDEQERGLLPAMVETTKKVLALLVEYLKQLPGNRK